MTSPNRVAAVVALFVAAATARDVLQCAANGGGGKGSFLAELVNPGLNRLAVYACTAAAPTNASCAPAEGATVDCGLTVPANASSFYVNFSLPGGAATAATLVYTAAQPFSFHALASTAPVTVAAAAAYPFVVPYPAPGALLCDADADCAGGAPCVRAPAPPRCGAAPPPPSPAPPAPVPSPAPGPPATTCPNITSELWEQKSLGAASAAVGGAAQHSADAYISIVSLAGGAFTWACKASHKPCPGGAAALNGTGQFSSTGAGFVLTPAPGSGVGAIAGTVNSTFSCTTLALLSGVAAPLQWDYFGPPRPTPFDTRVAVATYLGAPGSLFAATGVAILGPELIAVAGNGAAAGFPGVAPLALLGANASANGTVLLVSTAAPAAAAVIGVLRLGARVDHVRATAAGLVAVAGSFGVAVLRIAAGAGAGAGAASASVVWADDLTGATPGSCGVCCSGGGATTCRVDIGEDGTVVASLAAVTADGRWLWAAWAPSGARVLAQTAGAAALTDVFVDGARRAVGASWFFDANTGHEPMVMPAVASVDAASGAERFRTFPWSAKTYRSPGPCDGSVADARVLAARVGRDGTLLLAGRSDGGDTPFACGLRNASRVVPFAQIDGFTNAADMQSQAITNLLRVDGATGEVLVGQIQVTRLPGRGSGNTLLTMGATSDAAGNVYLLQNAACCIPNMPNLTVNGLPLAGWSDAVALQVLDERLETRFAWTHFTRPNSTGGSEPGDIDVRGSVVALVMQTDTDSVLAAPVAGTASNVGGARVGYLVVMPTVGAGR
jgi:hypothetical protein